MWIIAVKVKGFSYILIFLVQVGLEVTTVFNSENTPLNISKNMVK